MKRHMRTMPDSARQPARPFRKAWSAWIHAAILLGVADCFDAVASAAPAAEKGRRLPAWPFKNSSGKTRPARHGGKINFLFVDGHVEALRPEQIKEKISFGAIDSL